MPDPKFEIDHFGIAGYETVIVKAGRRKTTRVVPPAGEAFAFDRHDWTRRIEVCVSPTGRSVRVWINGEEATESVRKPAAKAPDFDEQVER